MVSILLSASKRRGILLSNIYVVAFHTDLHTLEMYENPFSHKHKSLRNNCVS